MLDRQNHNSPSKVDFDEGVEAAPAIITSEYYRNKRNTILRHLEEVTEVILESLIKISDNQYSTLKHSQDKGAKDALDLKSSLLRAHPFSDTWGSLEEHLPQDQLEDLAYQLNKKFEEYSQFLDDLAAGNIRGLTLLERPPQNFIRTNNFDSVDTKYRINIKVNPRAGEYGTILNMVRSFQNDDDLVAGGFQIKTLNGDTRDAVIVYLPERSFSLAAKHIIDLFKDDPYYNDRHSDPGIMFGVPVEFKEGRKMPGVRVTEEPAGEYDHSTFNTMQADVLSCATILYIQEVYKGDKARFCEDLGDLESDGRIKWEQDFPSYYARAAKDLVGEGANLDNIAFLSTGK